MSFAPVKDPSQSAITLSSLLHRMIVHETDIINRLQLLDFVLFHPVRLDLKWNKFLFTLFLIRLRLCVLVSSCKLPRGLSCCLRGKERCGDLIADVVSACIVCVCVCAQINSSDTIAQFKFTNSFFPPAAWIENHFANWLRWRKWDTMGISEKKEAIIWEVSRPGGVGTRLHCAPCTLKAAC